jgi:hypothetical protein
MEKKKDKEKPIWDLRCNTCGKYLGFAINGSKGSVDFHDIVDLIRIIKTNNAMPFYILRYLLKYRSVLIYDIECLNEGITGNKLNNWIDLHWSHSISVIELIEGKVKEEIRIPRNFTTKDVKKLYEN